MSYKKLFFNLVTTFCFLFLCSCTTTVPPGDYDANEVGKIKKVVPGTIISIRPVRLHSKTDENLSPLPTEASTNHKSHGFEYVIRLSSGSIISVVQAENIKLKNKQAILVIYGQNTRVVPDNGSDVY